MILRPAIYLAVGVEVVGSIHAGGDRVIAGDARGGRRFCAVTVAPPYGASSGEHRVVLGGGEVCGDWRGGDSGGDNSGRGNGGGCD